MVNRYKMAAAYAGPVVAQDEHGRQFTGDEGHLPEFVLASDYDALAKRCKEHEQFRHQHRDCDAMGVENQRLRARLAEAERDAVRYRWLRDRAWPFEFNGNTPVDADAAIDAAMRPPAKKHTPRCSYWDGLFAQVCNCGAADNERA